MCPYSLDSQGSREFIEGLRGRCTTSAWFTHHMPNSELFQLEGHDGPRPVSDNSWFIQIYKVPIRNIYFGLHAVRQMQLMD